MQNLKNKKKMTTKILTPLLATKRKKTKVAGETARLIDAEVINVKKEKGGNYDEYHTQSTQGR